MGMKKLEITSDKIESEYEDDGYWIELKRGYREASGNVDHVNLVYGETKEEICRWMLFV